MKTLSTFLILLFCLSIVGCSLSVFDKPEPQIDPISTSNPVDLQFPKDGQQSLFLGFVTSCQDPDRDFIYTQDTLILKIFERDGALFMVETLTEHSPLYVGGAFVEPNVYGVKLEDEKLIFSERGKSNFFQRIHNDTFDLNPKEIIDFTKTGCRLRSLENIFLENGNGKVNDWKVGEIELENRWMILAWTLGGQYTFYDKNSLYLSQRILGSGITQGWVKMD